MMFALVSLVAAAQLPGAPPAPMLDVASASLIVEELAGSDALLFPPSLHVVHAEDAGDGQLVVVVGGIDAHPVRDELRRETLNGALAARGLEGGVVWLALDETSPLSDVRDLGHDGVDEAANKAPSRASMAPRRLAPQARPRTSSEHPFGAALLGMRVALSPGHGWLVNADGTYSTQRSNHKFNGCGSCRGIVEDFFSSETVMNQIVPLLQGMGATVLIVREPDHLAAPVDPLIVDDGDDLYSEPEGTWVDGNTAGVGFQDDYRVNADTDPGRAVFVVPPLPRATRVSLRYADGANRTQGAIVSVVHEGGVRTINVDQTLFGRQWLDLGGALSFGSGGSVEVAHGPSTGFMIADAIKVGGGEHPDARKPWWQMGAKSFVPFAGAPSDVTVRNDVTIRPAYAELLGPDVYISIHANASGTAGGTTAHGTSAYRYSCGVFGDHSSSANATSCDDPAQSQALLDDVQTAIVSELRASWDPAWGDRGRLVADFGELRELDDTPGILVETAFFDNLAQQPGTRMSDNEALHDPRFRESFARGLVRGLASFLAPGSDVPPLRPTGVVAQNAPDGSLVISWDAVAGAVGYRVLRANLDSTRGRAFDEGVTVDAPATSLTLTSADGVVAGDAYAFRVVAASDDGEGYASQAVVARYRGPALAEAAGGARVPVLVVWGYDRKDAFVQELDNDDAGAVEHGRALRRVAFFDGALDEAVEAGAVSLGEYALVDVGVGKDSTEHDPLSPLMQDAIEAARADSDTAVILSGEEIGYAMVEIDGTGDAFFADTFSAAYVADDAETFDIEGTGILASVGANGAHLDDGTELYEVVYPDIWSALGDATTPLTYPDGTGAAVVTDRTALIGAGLEVIVDDDARAAIMEALVVHLIPGHVAEGEGEGEGEGDVGGGEGEGEAAGEGEGEGAAEGEGEGEGDADIDVKPVRILPPSSNGQGCGCSAHQTNDASAAAAAIGLALLFVSATVRSRTRRERAIV